jgi:hypothetical protein
MVETELSEMKAVRALIRQLVPTGLFPPPPIVSHPQSSALFTLFGVLDEPKSPGFFAARGLDELLPSFSIEKAGRGTPALRQRGASEERPAPPIRRGPCLLLL